MKQITLAEWTAACRAQGVPRLHIAVKCCMCGTVQSMADLIAAGQNEGSAAKQLGFSCVGRFKGAGAHERGTPPGKGCDWSLGGLFKLHKLEVITDDGPVPSFELATPEEAQAHMRCEPQKFTPVRIQLSRRKGWKMPPNTVKVDRSTIWGNPFYRHGDGHVMEAGVAVSLFRDMVSKSGGWMANVRGGQVSVDIEDVKRELRGKNLACWCSLGQPCHADVLLELANA